MTGSFPSKFPRMCVGLHSQFLQNTAGGNQVCLSPSKALVWQWCGRMFRMGFPGMPVFPGSSTDIAGLSIEGLLPWGSGIDFCLEDLLPFRSFVLPVLQVSSQELSNSWSLVLSVSSAFKYWEQYLCSLFFSSQFCIHHFCGFLCSPHRWIFPIINACFACESLEPSEPPEGVTACLFLPKKLSFLSLFLPRDVSTLLLVPLADYLKFFLPRVISNLPSMLILPCFWFVLYPAGVLLRYVIHHPLFPIASCLLMIMTERWRVKTADK